MEYLPLVVFIGKFTVYFLFFLAVGAALKLGPWKRALIAALHRLWLGLAAIVPIVGAYMALEAVMPRTASNPRPSEIAATGFVWLLRGISWWLAARWGYPALKNQPYKYPAIVALGFALNIVLDLGVFGLPGEGRGRFAPTMGFWDLAFG